MYADYPMQNISHVLEKLIHDAVHTFFLFTRNGGLHYGYV